MSRTLTSGLPIFVYFVVIILLSAIIETALEKNPSNECIYTIHVLICLRMADSKLP